MCGLNRPMKRQRLSLWIKIKLQLCVFYENLCYINKGVNALRSHNTVHLSNNHIVKYMRQNPVQLQGEIDKLQGEIELQY